MRIRAAAKMETCAESADSICMPRIESCAENADFISKIEYSIEAVPISEAVPRIESLPRMPT